MSPELVGIDTVANRNDDSKEKTAIIFCPDTQSKDRPPIGGELTTFIKDSIDEGDGLGSSDRNNDSLSTQAPGEWPDEEILDEQQEKKIDEGDGLCYSSDRNNDSLSTQDPGECLAQEIPDEQQEKNIETNIRM